MKFIFKILLLGLVVALYGLSAVQAKSVSLAQNEDLEIIWEGEPLFSLENMAPGDSVSKKVSIKNISAKETKVYFFAEHKNSSENMLANVLTVKAKCDDKQVYQDTLAELFSISDSIHAPLLGVISAGNSLLCNLQVSFDENADNTCQGLTQNCDFGLGFVSGEDKEIVNEEIQEKQLEDKKGNDEEQEQEQQGTVLGSVEALPQTGIYPSPLPFILLAVGLWLRIITS